jgi:hypothetical protein
LAGERGVGVVDAENFREAPAGFRQGGARPFGRNSPNTPMRTVPESRGAGRLKSISRSVKT